jgi:arginyl-tRNA synthetase
MLKIISDNFRETVFKVLNIDLVVPEIIPTNNSNFGDYQCNIAMILAKKLKQPPKVVAIKIVENLDLGNICESIEIAGAGFINLRIRPEYLVREILRIYADPERLGVKKTTNPEKIIVDFSSPNIAKEMHVGHLRSTVIGDSIAQILEFKGHDVLRLNHLGDWGTQFGMLIAYLKEEKPEVLSTANVIDLGDLVTLYRQAKLKFDEDLAFQEKARKEVVKLQAKTPDSIKAWQLLCEQSRKEFEKIYQLLDIKITERGESFYNPYLPEVINKLTTLGLITEDQGAKCVFLDEPTPLIVQKSDGGYNYATTDLAAIMYRVDVDKANRVLYITDAGQANHFKQVFKVADAAGFTKDTKLIHIPFGLVCNEHGRKLKTRSGDTTRLIDLLDEAISRSSKLNEDSMISRVIGVSAVKYADLSTNRITDYCFNYDNMLALQGNTAPYLLYSYVRIQGILRKLDKEIEADKTISFTEESELALAKHLLLFDYTLFQAERDYLPNRICTYLFELSQKFNQFYERCPILNSNSRLVLADLTGKTLKLGLFLLGIPILNKM